MQESRRDRNKARMRRRISDTATALFLERGFDAVSVSEIAEAADVARPTVFAHFPRKEDLLLDRFDDTLADLVGSVRARPAGTSAVATVTQWALARARGQEPPIGVRADFVPLWRTVAGSRALQARARELAELAETALAAALAETGAPHPTLTAALLVAAARAVHLSEVSALLAGGTPDAVDRYVGRLTVAFDAVAAAVTHLDPPCRREKEA